MRNTETALLAAAIRWLTENDPNGDYETITLRDALEIIQTQLDDD